MTALATRLATAAASLEAVQRLSDSKPGHLRGPVLTSLTDLTCKRTDLELLSDNVEARDGAEAFLRGLPGRVGTDGKVHVAGATMSFPAARLFGMQAWVSMHWAVADRITDLVGRVLCLDSVSKDPRQGAQTVSHFVTDAKSASVLVHLHVKESFGWPIGVAYAVRNHMAHDAGVRSGVSMFASSDPALKPFEISRGGLQYVEERARSYRVAEGQTRITEDWPWGGGDIRELLRVCHSEMDDALGLLLVSSTKTLEAHVGFLLGEL